ncbi:MAG: dTMP kinase [Desulfobacterales bacterium]|jgi:dTMP kinase|nr:dTMP kinase [Desulfobacterales bacterium]
MLITLEGIEGSGKTTQISHIVEFLKGIGHDCVVTKEPGGTGIGEKIRSILLDPGNAEIHPLTELLLYAADRVQHIQELIHPMISMGKIVICDRFHDSTTVYQGVSRGLDMKMIHDVHQLVLGGFKPDVTFVLDLPAEIGLMRAWDQINNGSRPSAETRFENEKLIFHEKVRRGYLELARKEPERFIVIDASGNENDVKEKIQSELAPRLIRMNLNKDI